MERHFTLNRYKELKEDEGFFSFFTKVKAPILDGTYPDYVFHLDYAETKQFGKGRLELGYLHGCVVSLKNMHTRIC